MAAAEEHWLISSTRASYINDLINIVPEHHGLGECLRLIRRIFWRIQLEAPPCYSPSKWEEEIEGKVRIMRAHADRIVTQYKSSPLLEAPAPCRVVYEMSTAPPSPKVKVSGKASHNVDDVGARTPTSSLEDVTSACSSASEQYSLSPKRGNSQSPPKCITSPYSPPKCAPSPSQYTPNPIHSPTRDRSSPNIVVASPPRFKTAMEKHTHMAEKSPVPETSSEAEVPDRKKEVLPPHLKASVEKQQGPRGDNELEQLGLLHPVLSTSLTSYATSNSSAATQGGAARSASVYPGAHTALPAKATSTCLARHNASPTPINLHQVCAENLNRTVLTFVRGQKCKKNVCSARFHICKVWWEDTKRGHVQRCRHGESDYTQHWDPASNCRVVHVRPTCAHAIKSECNPLPALPCPFGHDQKDVRGWVAGKYIA